MLNNLSNAASCFDRRLLLRPSRQASGATLIWVVACLFLFIALTGLSLDTAYVSLVAHQLQNAADASALAGALKVKLGVDEARDLAVDVGGANTAANHSVTLDRNDANADGGDVVVGRFNRNEQTFTPQTDDRNAVKVVARRTESSADGPLPLLFGPAFGVDTSEVARTAIGMVGGGEGAGVIALNPTVSCSFDLRGTAGSLVVNDGIIYVNSSHPDAACHSGQPSLVSDELHVYGGTDGNFDRQVNFDGDLYTGTDPIPDPLAGLPEPTYDPASSLGTIRLEAGETVNASPGYYAGGITVRNGTLNLSPGIYILDGAGLDVNGGNLYALGVMFYIVGTGFVDVRGNGIVTITPPDAATYSYPSTPDITPYSDAGVSIFQARTNTNDSRILGTASFNIEGTLYFPVALLEVGGTSDNFANGLIADRIYAHGDGALVVNYDDRFPRVPAFVFLVK